jgi:putative flippase GtrA
MKISFFDASIPKFLLVGMGNTILSAIIMLALEDLGYWPSTAIAYLIGAVMSFFLNRKFTFQSDMKIRRSAVRFALNVAVCYILAYVIAQPLGRAILGTIGVEGAWMERLTKLGGIGIYTVLNYLGQRFFAFREKM